MVSKIYTISFDDYNLDKILRCQFLFLYNDLYVLANAGSPYTSIEYIVIL